jgi:hypothetical protein
MTRDRFDSLERFTPLFEPPDPSFGGFLLRRDRRRRNERVAAGAVGLAVFAAMIWAVASGGIQRTTRPPGTEPTPEYPGAVGLQGLPPVGAAPSSPAGGELVLSFSYGRTEMDAERFSLSLYADGRLIWERLGDGIPGGLPATGLIEQRLTPEGVELVRSEVLSTGLFDHDLDLASGQGLFSGEVRVRDGERLVRVTWGDDYDVGEQRTAPTRQQANTLRRLDGRLLNPTAWLPASAWERQELGPFLPSRFAVCYNNTNEETSPQFEDVLAAFPPPAANLLRSWDRTRENLGGPTVWCSRVTTDEAHILADILQNAGSQQVNDGPELGYYFGGGPEVPRVQVSLRFMPLLPHEP